MAGEKEEQATQSKELPFPPGLPEFPPNQFPVLWVDGVLNVSATPGIVKVYMVRSDPSLTGTNQQRAVPNLQLVMPASAFVGSVLYSYAILDLVIHMAGIPQQEVDRLKGEVEKIIPQLRDQLKQAQQQK